ncbi:MAG: Asp-tRNA(Asn)/Glu-tRNA(Gln) amidotransferase subunit GatB [bacterium]|nr:Asp-tRNA(Asn)/Glu-tRNA(Gln) amidotransferase subunit GatB [bacterium]
MSKYIPTIGLEIHAELKTQTKMFCNSKNDPDEKRPNVNICPVCMAHPGTLPVINKEAVKHVLKVGVAVGGKLADFTEFDRKNYFYPDIPKGYQISQYKYPLISGGALSGVKITRVHLEEDTARSSHDQGDFSLIDYNRAGVPLMELVTEPVIHDTETAVRFAKELQLILRYLGAGEANMEKGEMRVEANVSVAETFASADGRRTDAEQRRKKKLLGTKVEIKNLNSFRVVERAIAYEIERQTKLIESGEKVIQETRGWDEGKQKTFSQRLKEDSHDYRYFPDPDLPKLYISEIPEFSKKNLQKELPELPWQKRQRYLKLGLKPEDAEMFVADGIFGGLFDEVEMILNADAELLLLAVNYITSDLAGLSKNLGKVFAVSARNFATLMKMIKENKVSSRGAKDLLAHLFENDTDPEKLAEEKGLLQKSDPEALKKIIEEVVAENEKAVAEYKAGKESSLQFLVGQGMKKSKGSANPQVLRNIFTELLK